MHASNCKRILFKQLSICKQGMHSDTDLVTSFLTDLRRPHSFQMPCSIILLQLLSCPDRMHITYRMFTPIGAKGKLLTMIFFHRHWRNQEQTELLDHTAYSSAWFCELKGVETFVYCRNIVAFLAATCQPWIFSLCSWYSEKYENVISVTGYNNWRKKNKTKQNRAI